MSIANMLSGGGVNGVDKRSLLEIESAIVDASANERKAWAEVRTAHRFVEGSVEMESRTDGAGEFCVECEGFSSQPEMVDLENAFTGTIKKWYNALAKKIGAIIARIQKWIDSAFNKMDAAFWEKKADDAFSTAASCKGEITIREWNFKEVHDMPDEIDAEFDEALKKFEKATKDNDASFKEEADDLGGLNEMTVKKILSDMFVTNGDYTKKKSQKLSKFTNKNVMEKIFLSARADKAYLNDTKKSLQKYLKELKALSTKDMGDSAMTVLSALKKVTNTGIKVANISTGLVMERRANIKSIVNNLYTHFKEEDKKKD